MAEGRGPLYLARASYRRRRLIDALRLLPFLLLGLWLLPLLWGGGGTDAPVGAGARAFLHVFLVWIAGVALEAWLARRLAHAEGLSVPLSAEQRNAVPAGEGPIWASYSDLGAEAEGDDASPSEQTDRETG